MSQSKILKLASVACIVLAAASVARAEGGGGGNDRLNDAAAVAAKPARPILPWASGSSTLPDGTRITSEGVGGGRRVVTTRTPDGNAVRGPRGNVLPKDKINRTVYNSKTGITSTFTRNADGSVTGVHVDRQGNRSTSTSWPK
jgi:hypothetical protein